MVPPSPLPAVAPRSTPEEISGEWVALPLTDVPMPWSRPASPWSAPRHVDRPFPRVEHLRWVAWQDLCDRARSALDGTPRLDDALLRALPAPGTRRVTTVLFDPYAQRFARVPSTGPLIAEDPVLQTAIDRVLEFRARVHLEEPAQRDLLNGLGPEDEEDRIGAIQRAAERCVLHREVGDVRTERRTEPPRARL